MNLAGRNCPSQKHRQWIRLVVSSDDLIGPVDHSVAVVVVGVVDQGLIYGAVLEVACNDS